MRRIVLFATLGSFVPGLIAGFPTSDLAVAAPRSAPVPAGTSASLKSQKTLCERYEQVVFTCTMQKSGKVASICTSKPYDSLSGYVQYRFGQPGKIELEFPAERKNTQSAFSYLRYTRPLVTYLSLRFELNGYKYSIHQDSNAEEKPSVNTSYLRITSPEPDAKPIEMNCRQPDSGSLMLLEDTVPRSEG